MDKKILVNGKEISLEEFNELSNNPKVKLKKVDENTYIKLERIYG